MNLLIFLLTVLVMGGAFSAIYEALIRPSLIFQLRRRAIAVRDDLKLAVLSGQIGDHEKAVRPTMRKLNSLINACDHVGVMGVLFVMMSEPQIRFEAERDAEINKEASSEMKEIIRRADMLVVVSVVINSPFFWFVLPPLYALGALTGRITRWINSVSLSGKDGMSNDGSQLATA